MRVVIGMLFNPSSLRIENYLDRDNARLQNTLRQLASGSKLNSAADDPAAISLASGMHANVAALNQSTANIEEDTGVLRVADGALSQVTSLLNRAITLATESSNGTLNQSQLDAANDEYQSILSEISNIGKTTTYNQQSVFGTTLDAYVGDSTLAGSMIDSLHFSPLTLSHLGDSGGSVSMIPATDTTSAKLSYTPGSSVDLSHTDMSTTPNAQSTLYLLNSAIASVSAQDGYLGTQINTMTAVSSILNTQSENTLAALNAIEGVDYAKATSDLASEQIMMQGAIASLAQSNQMYQDVLKLIQ
ncbi:flagellin [Telmatobacter bradus]|uniref:flagellin n=1 Tax=Telmatobacter bradus TaxID=474953 RepID=UPI003B42C1B5